MLETFDSQNWHDPYSATDQARAVAALEAGKVLFLPRLTFRLLNSETRFLSADLAGGTRKNVSYDPVRGALGGTKPGPDGTEIAAMMQRFGRDARALVTGLTPSYAPHLEQARTSFRPVPVQGRAQSVRHDDRLLHVDAFPSRPMRGRRILRVFSNISPDGSPREWCVGGPFVEYANRFVPRVRPQLSGAAMALASLGLTKGRRSAYDSLMLGLHDAGKFDTDWQRDTPHETIDFPSGSTWMCFTDIVLHAAMAGRCALEQTFHIPVGAMARPELSPLRILERLTNKSLT